MKAKEENKRLRWTIKGAESAEGAHEKHEGGKNVKGESKGLRM